MYLLQKELIILKPLANASRGVDNGENFLDAAYRELEETNKNVELIQEIEEEMTYELPMFIGCHLEINTRVKQKWFLMRYLGSDNEINIKTNKPEFLEWKWIDLDMLQML